MTLLSFNGILSTRCRFFFFQAEDGIRYLVRSRGLGDVYKRQPLPAMVFPSRRHFFLTRPDNWLILSPTTGMLLVICNNIAFCLLYTSDAADERSSVDLGGRRIIKKKQKTNTQHTQHTHNTHTSTDARPRPSKQYRTAQTTSVPIPHRALTTDSHTDYIT